MHQRLRPSRRPDNDVGLRTRRSQLESRFTGSLIFTPQRSETRADRTLIGRRPQTRATRDSFIAPPAGDACRTGHDDLRPLGKMPLSSLSALPAIHANHDSELCSRGVLLCLTGCSCEPGTARMTARRGRCGLLEQACARFTSHERQRGSAALSRAASNGMSPLPNQLIRARPSRTVGVLRPAPRHRDADCVSR